MWLSRARRLGVVTLERFFFLLSLSYKEKRPALRELEKFGVWRFGSSLDGELAIVARIEGAWQRRDVTAFKTQGSLCLLAEMKVDSREFESKRRRLPKCMDAVIADMQASPYGPYSGLQPLEDPLRPPESGLRDALT